MSPFFYKIKHALTVFSIASFFIKVQQNRIFVLPSEMPLSFSYEALKAQAVCARTFTYGQMKNDTYARYGANLDDSIAYQAYHATTSYEVTDQAVADTAGMVMTYKGKLADCYYYSTSPGYSENLEVWNAASPGYLLAENHTREKTKDLSSDKAFHKSDNNTGSKGNQYDNIYGSHSM